LCPLNRWTIWTHQLDNRPLKPNCRRGLCHPQVFTSNNVSIEIPTKWFSAVPFKISENRLCIQFERHLHRQRATITTMLLLLLQKKDAFLNTRHIFWIPASRTNDPPSYSFCGRFVVVIVKMSGEDSPYRSYDGWMALVGRRQISGPTNWIGSKCLGVLRNARRRLMCGFCGPVWEM
jgi:hypothetical protein